MKRKKDGTCPYCGHSDEAPWYGKALVMLFAIALATWFILLTYLGITLLADLAQSH